MTANQMMGSSLPQKSAEAKRISRVARATPKRVLEQQQPGEVVKYTPEQWAARQQG